jgi:hypothetical protein
MPVNRAACELILETEKQIDQVLQKIQEIKAIIKKIVSTKGKIKYGLINILDTLGAEAITAINAIAATVANNIMGSISQMAANVFERIVADILKVLLSYPDAIFSLIAIPHKAAVEACHAETSALSRAKQNISEILHVTKKWSTGYNGRSYYDQMKNAQPFILAALEIADDMIKDLEGDVLNPGDTPNSYFDERKYKDLQANIQQAVDITFPSSIVNDKAQITNRIEASKDQKYRELSKPIIAKFKEKQKELDRQYFKDIQEVQIKQDEANNVVNDTAAALKIDALTQRYNFLKNGLDLQKKESLEAARLRASLKASIDGSAYAKAINGRAAEFSYDAQRLAQSLSELVSNFGDAFSSYRSTQNYCNVIYRIRDFLRNLINEAINIMRKSGNETGEVLINAIELAKANLGVANDRFDKTIDRFESPEKKVSATEMSSQVTVGHAILNTANAALHATITQSMIDLINADDVLASGAKEFDEFLIRLSEIPDWDGAKNVWAVDPESSALSPYVQLIADSTSLLAKTPAAAATKEEEVQAQVNRLLSRVNAGFRRVRKHNSVVLQELSSFSPPVSPEGGNLINLLKGGGLLETFASTMSFANIASSLISSISKGGLDAFAPTHANCAQAYPDLFQDPEVAKAYAIESANISTPQFDTSWQENLEDVIDDINKAREYVNNYHAIGNLDNEDLISPPDNTTPII